MSAPLRLEPIDLEASALAVPGAYEGEVRLARMIALYIEAMPLEAMARRASDECEMAAIRRSSRRPELARDRSIVELPCIHAKAAQENRAVTAVYDSNFSVQLVERRVEQDPIDEGTECRCNKCSGRLQIVCEKGCDDPMERVRKSKGPVPSAPRAPEKMKKLRQCTDCPATLPQGSKRRRCEACAGRGRERRCACGRPIETKLARHCDACRQKRRDEHVHTPRKPVPDEKECRTCHVTKPQADFEVVYAHYRRADCRECRKAERKKARAAS
jgi:hypothetical protein